MSFRYDEAVADVYQSTLLHSVIELFKTESERKEAKAFIDRMVEDHGPIIIRYPDWHPLRVFAGNGKFTESIRGYIRHTLYFRDAVLLAPSDFQDVPFETLAAICENNHMLVREETGLYYHRHCKLYVVEALGYTCDEGEKYLPQKVAVGGLLDSWRDEDGGGIRMPIRNFQCWESWEAMHPHLLGTPCGKRSSVFVDEKTGQAIKRLFSVMGESLGLKEHRRI